MEVYGLDRSEEWRKAWEELPAPERDVFARPEYYEAFQAAEPGASAECAVLRSKGRVLLYPYFRRPLTAIPWLGAPSGSSDIITAYGYGGICGLRAAPELAAGFDRELVAHCTSTGVVAELIRINPLTGGAADYAGRYAVLEGNLQVVVDVRRDDEDIWRSYRHNNRKNVQKAIRSGVSVVCEEGRGPLFGEFRKIYTKTMERRDASGYFRFSDEFFDKLTGGLGSKALFFHAIMDGKVVSTELALASDTALYSFLGGTDEASFEYRPANLVKHEMIRWARDAGLSSFLLGGGPAGQDGIFEFKRSFAPDGVIRFSMAWRVHDRALYDVLYARCMEHPPQSEEAAAAYPLRWRFGG